MTGRIRGLCQNRRAAPGVAAVIVAALLAVAGCGSSSSHAVAQLPGAAMARAAHVSSAASGYRIAFNMRETVPSAGQVTITGSGSFAVPTHAGSMKLQMALPAGAGAGLGSLQFQAVYVPGTVYLKVPSELAGKLPGAKSWLEMNLDQVGKAAGVSGLGSLTSGASSLNDPSEYLDFLRATSNGSVKDLGQATIDGIKTTHYHAEVDLEKLPDAVPTASRQAVQQLVTALARHGVVTQLPIDAWIDSAHLIRRIALAYSQPVSGSQSVDVSLQVDFKDYGPQPAPTIPAPDQTTNLLALTHGSL